MSYLCKCLDCEVMFEHHDMHGYACVECIKTPHTIRLLSQLHSLASVHQATYRPDLFEALEAKYKKFMKYSDWIAKAYTSGKITFEDIQEACGRES